MTRCTYLCPSCNYETKRRGDMRKHFGLVKPCPKQFMYSIDLTDEIKERVLDHRRYFPPSTHHPAPIRKSLGKALQNAVWNEWIGEKNGAGPCLCCKKEVTHQSFEYGHVLAVAHGGTNMFDNLRIVCIPCNRSMKDEHMFAFMERVGF